MRYFYTLILVFIVSLIFWGTTDLIFANHVDFDPNNLIDDGAFVNVDDMNAAEIQSFLEQKKSFLKDYSEHGRTAAQIIWGAAHGYGDATETINGIKIDASTGTVSPSVILVTLEKEQGLISKKTQDDNALRKAMGFACPDGSGCNPDYAGFTKQVEVGTWQLRYNFERAHDSRFSNYQVGQTQCFDDSHVGKGTTCVTFANRATAALYRYTPYVYNGNHRFHELWHKVYNFGIRLYDYLVSYQSNYPSIAPGQSAQFQLRVVNTGSATWSASTVRLGTDRPRDRVPGFIREGPAESDSGWVWQDRIKMQQKEVKSGETATFVFWLTPSQDKPPGTYREYFNLVADGVAWFPSQGIYWDITVLGPERIYIHNVTYQNGHPVLKRGESYNFVVSVRNTGQTTWSASTVRLGTDRPRDRVPGFIREGPAGSVAGWTSENRVRMQQALVNSGQMATFSFFYTVPSDKTPGTYREHFRMVADGITWMEDYGIYWDIQVVE